MKNDCVSVCVHPCVCARACRCLHTCTCVKCMLFSECGIKRHSVWAERLRAASLSPVITRAGSIKAAELDRFQLNRQRKSRPLWEMHCLLMAVRDCSSSALASERTEMISLWKNNQAAAGGLSQLEWCGERQFGSDSRCGSLQWGEVGKKTATQIGAERETGAHIYKAPAMCQALWEALFRNSY